MNDSAVAEPATNRSSTSAPTVPWAARVAGVLLMVVGALNLAFGVVSMASTLVRLAPGAAGGLVVAGALTILTGWFVWRGNRSATRIALGVFVWLLAAQIADFATHGDPGAAPGGFIGRFAAIVLVLAVLVLAVLQMRTPRRRN